MSFASCLISIIKIEKVPNDKRDHSYTVWNVCVAVTGAVLKSHTRFRWRLQNVLSRRLPLASSTVSGRPNLWTLEGDSPFFWFMDRFCAAESSASPWNKSWVWKLKHKANKPKIESIIDSLLCHFLQQPLQSPITTLSSCRFSCLFLFYQALQLYQVVMATASKTDDSLRCQKISHHHNDTNKAIGEEDRHLPAVKCQNRLFSASRGILQSLVTGNQSSF